MLTKFLGWSGLSAATAAGYFLNLKPANEALGNALSVYAMLTVCGCIFRYMHETTRI